MRGKIIHYTDIKVQDLQIPLEVLVNPRLTSTEKILFSTIKSLRDEMPNENLSNRHIASILGIKPKSVSELIKKLEDYKYINVTYHKKSNQTNEMERLITVHEESMKSIYSKVYPYFVKIFLSFKMTDEDVDECNRLLDEITNNK